MADNIWGAAGQRNTNDDTYQDWLNSTIPAALASPNKYGGYAGYYSPYGTQDYQFGPIPYPTYDSILQGMGPSGGATSGAMVNGVIQRPTLGAVNNQDPMGLPTDLTLSSQYNDQYMDELYGYATSEDPSPWLEMQLQNITSYGKTAGDTMTAQQAGSVAQAQEALAMRGGIDSGAAERLQQAGIDSRMMGSQTLARDVEEQRRQMRIAEEASKLGVLQAMPGYEAQRAAYESELQNKNIANVLAERDRERQAAIDKYEIQMNAWASNQLANATARG